MSRDSLWLVAGATGGTGSHAMQLLWAAGIRTRALTRSKNNESRLRQLGASEVVTGSLLDPQVAAAAVDGVKIVLCAVGPAIKNLFFGEMVDDLGTMNLIEAASRAGVHHFVFESSIGVGDSRDGLSALDRFFLRRQLGPKHRAETRLREAGVPFTILRPGRLLHGSANGDLLVTERGGTTTGSIARADVARLMVASPFTTSAHGKTLEVVGAGDGRAPQSQRVTVAWSPPQRREA
jgi:uncharacterized protein YbjT (DUF2867 family)